jgi:hypothetical protein
MKVQGAVIKEQGITFAIVVVKRRVIQNTFQANKTSQSFGNLFPGMPVILMAQNNRGTPTYYGRRDIVRFLSKVPMHAIPWKEYTFS